jgi:TPP-dependent pyruvate/acetoin dehydrogenase alpha subunit
LVYSLSLEEATSFYRNMVLIREIELEISRRYSEGRMRCPTHLSVGQESTPAALSLYIRDTDYAVSTHRSHAHYLAKGGDVQAMLAEIYGLEAGCSMGRGGSMHLVDKEVGFMGSSAIVGNSIPVGVGLALAQKMDSIDGIAVVYIGDAAVEEGVFFESANFAATREIPVLFVCENNGFSVYSGMHVRQPIGRTISAMVSGIGIESERLSCTDLGELIVGISQAVSYCRETRKPFFIEVETQRYLEHCGPNNDDHLGYRDLDHLNFVKSLDPITQMSQMLKEAGTSVESINKEIRLKVNLDFGVIEAMHNEIATNFQVEN